MTLPTTNPMCYSSRVSNTAVHTGLAEIFPRSPLASVPLCIGCSNIGCQEQRVQFQRITKSTYCRKSHRFLSQDTVTHVLFILTLFHLLIRFAGTCCLIWFRLPEQYKTCDFSSCWKRISLLMYSVCLNVMPRRWEKGSTCDELEVNPISPLSWRRASLQRWQRPPFEYVSDSSSFNNVAVFNRMRKGVTCQKSVIWL